MAKRLILCPVIGSGVEGDFYRAKANDYGVAWAGIIPTNPDGTPRFPWCLVVVQGPDLAPLLADPDVFAIPARAFDDPVSSLSAGQRTAIATRLSALGVETSGLAGLTVGQLVRRLARHLEPEADEFGLNVPGT